VYHLFREKDLSDFPRWVRVVVYPVRISLRSFEEFFKDKCLQSASALAFASLLALVPVVAIFFFFLTKLEAFSEIQLRIEDFLFNNLLPARTDVIREYLSQYTQNITFVGVFGVTTLFIAAIFMFNTIEHAINDIWHAKKRRPFLSKFSAFWTVLTAAPVLVFLSSYIAARLAIGEVDSRYVNFLPYLLNWLAFWFAYQFIPYTQVRFRAALVGAIVGGTLWEVAKAGFNWYIGNVTAIDRVYGSLGTVPVFLLWLYLTWVIVLFGAEVAYAVQYPEGRSRLSHDELLNYLEFYSVRTIAEIVRRFQEGGGKASSTIGHLKDSGIPAELLGEILNRLAENDLIAYTEDKEYVPARQPSRITVREVIDAVAKTEMLTPGEAGDSISKKLKETFEKVSTSVDATLDGLNIQTLVNGEESWKRTSKNNVEQKEV
jgi:membrane protein